MIRSARQGAQRRMGEKRGISRFPFALLCGKIAGKGGGGVSGRRLYWIDLLKFVGIVAIVLGHALGEGPLCTYLYAFHVPMFFFASGCAFRRTKERFGAFALRKLRQLIVPYLLMSFLSILALYAASFVMELPLGIRFTQPWYRYAWGILYANGKSGMLKANAPLWFLPCMFCVLLMLYGVAHLAKGKKLVYAALTALSAAIGLLNERFRVIDRWPLGFETALHMLPFALMGYAFRSVSEKIETMPDARKAVAGGVLIAAGTAVQMGFDVSGLYMFDRYSSLALLYVCALAISVGVALLGMVRVLPRLRLVSYVGGHTFVILLFHKFPLLVFRYLCPGIGPRLLAGSVPLALAATAVTLALCLAAEKPLARICPALLGRRRKQAV